MRESTPRIQVKNGYVRDHSADDPNLGCTHLSLRFRILCLAQKVSARDKNDSVLNGPLFRFISSKLDAIRSEQGHV